MGLFCGQDIYWNKYLGFIIVNFIFIFFLNALHQTPGYVSFGWTKTAKLVMETNPRGFIVVSLVTSKPLPF